MEIYHGEGSIERSHLQKTHWAGKSLPQKEDWTPALKPRRANDDSHRGRTSGQSQTPCSGSRGPSRGVIRPIDLLRPLTRDINFLVGEEDEEDPEYSPKSEPNLRIRTMINQGTAARLQYFWKMFLDQDMLALRERWQNKAGKGPKLREG